MKNALDKLSKEQQREFWASLALRHCPKMTQRLIRSLLIQYGSAYAVFSQATSPLSPQTTKPFPKDLSVLLKQEKWRETALLEWREAKVFNGEILLWTDYRYPLELKHLADAPAFLYAKGDLSLLSSVCVAIVGSRKFHIQTLQKSEEIAEDLSNSGICVVSGMAKGIDHAAHKGALRGIGKTIAVLGCGADIIYPVENTNLYHQILESGLIISEFSPQTKPHSKNFPIRNRIVSGLSAAVLVAEAELKSGSLITARTALEQNRHVYTLTPLHENHSRGTQNLINDGAVQIQDALTILADIAPHLQDKLFSQNNLKKTKHNGTNFTKLSIDYKKLTEELMGDHETRDIEEILKPKKKTRSHTKEEKEESESNNKHLTFQNNKDAEPAPESITYKDRTSLDSYEQSILQILEINSPLCPDDILLSLENSSISELTSALLMLEVDAYVERISGNRYQLYKN